MRVAVTGGTGYVGRHVVEALAAAGHAVVVLARPGSDRTGFPRPPAFVTGSLGEPASFEALLNGADALVHAALDHAPGRFRGGEGDDLAAFTEVNVTGSLRLLDAARRRGVGRCVVLSSRAVFPRRWAGRTVDEDSAIEPDTHYGAAKAALEAFASSFAGQDRWPVAALRLTGVYGVSHPFERTKWLPLIRAAMAGQGDLPVRAGTEVHGRDAAAAVRLLLEAPAEAVGGRVFHCSDLLVTTREIAALVQAATGASGPLPPAPDGPPPLVLDSGRLRGLGLRFGGRPLLEATVREIVALAAPGDAILRDPRNVRSDPE